MRRHSSMKAASFGIVARRGDAERVVGRDRHELGAEQRVRPRRVNLQLARARLVRQGPARSGIDGEAHQHALGPADPVALHQAHLVGPAVEPVEPGEQFVGIVADLEEPLRQFALFDDGAGAPAAPVDHLLVGEHGVVDRVPIDLRLLARDQAGGEEVEKQLLLMAVIGGVAGGDLARPVERQAHRLELRAHRVDVGVGPLGGMGGVLHRGVLGRHAERVPAHRVQHVEAARALVARHHVAHRVVAHMAHMDAPRGVREHLEHVILRPRIVVARGEYRPVGPDLLPLLLGFADVVAFGPHVSEVSFSRNVRRTAATKHDLPGGVKSAGRGRASRRWAPEPASIDRFGQLRHVDDSHALLPPRR